MKLGDFNFKLAGGEPPPPETALSVESSVDGARVYVDGKFVGVTNLSDQPIAPGRRTIKVTKQGRKTYERTINISKGRSVFLPVDLPEVYEVRPPTQGRIYVNCDPENARVKILNIGPRFYQGISLDPGEYHMEISAARDYKVFFRVISWLNL